MNYFKQRFKMNGIAMSILLAIFYFLLLKTTSYLFWPCDDLTSLTIAIVLGFINLISVYYEFKRSNIVSRTLMYFSEVVKWFSIMYLLLVIVISVINLFYQIPTNITRLSLIILLILFVYSYYCANYIKIKDKTLYLNNLDEEITIAHISDMHVGSIVGDRFMRKIANKLNEANPDLTIISGDIADGTCAISENHFKELEKVKDPIIFTPGNHDYYPDINHVIRAAENAGIRVLDNEMIKYKNLNIYGLSYSFYHETKLDFDINKEENNLLVYHVPSNWDEFSELGFNIQLSGHTHGGQFFPAMIWVKLFFPHLRGLFEKNGNYLNVSDGIGTFGPPLRLGTRSEISLLHLKNRN